MKTAIDVTTGRIVGYDEKSGELLIRAPYDDYLTLTKREYKKCQIQLIDNRPLSDKQRRACYALLREIAAYSGEGTDRTKEYMKIKFLADDFGETADRIFSLANAPMSLVCAFQRFLVRFILDWDIPCNFSLREMVDDMGDYIYACLINKKCCVCGKRADLHHIDHVGTGRDREGIIHEGMEVMPLCREHHTQAHTLGQRTFNEKYHFDGGIGLDRTLCKIYGLRSKRNVKQDRNNGTTDARPGAEAHAD